MFTSRKPRARIFEEMFQGEKREESREGRRRRRRFGGMGVGAGGGIVFHIIITTQNGVDLSNELNVEF